MLVSLVVSLLATCWVIGATMAGYWAGGGWVPALLLGGFAAYIMYGHVVPAALRSADPGSIRQARKTLRQAQEAGRPVAIVSARGRMALIRWQRRS